MQYLSMHDPKKLKYLFPVFPVPNCFNQHIPLWKFFLLMFSSFFILILAFSWLLI